MDDRELVMKVKKEDTDAFELLVRQNEKGVYNFCLKMCGNSEDAFDLSQEAFVKAYRGIAAFKGESSFSTWLYRLTSNVCIDFLRRQKKEKERVLPLSVECAEGETMEMQLKDTEPMPCEHLEQKELRQEIEDALSQLRQEYRQVIVLREIDGLTYEEIAGVLDISVGTVKSRISRARAEMCRSLKKRWNFSQGTASNKMKGE